MSSSILSTPKVFRHPLARSAVQLPCGLLFMAIVSFLPTFIFGVDAVYTSNFRNTFSLAIVAHLLGYIAYRKLDIFPGMAAIGAILPTFILSYGAILVLVLLLRFEYSRLVALVSFTSTISWHLALNILVRRLSAYRLATIPGGEADQLRSIKGVSWIDIRSPGEAIAPIQGVVADLRAELCDEWERYIADCALSGVPVYHAKQVLESLTGRVAITHISENTLGSLSPNQTYISVKQALDFLAALVLLLIVAPLVVIVALAIRLTSPGPALFRQKRVGYRGQVFTVFKFRTMYDRRHADSDAIQEAMTRDNDTRVTHIGALLRRTRIDELPQILNILRGEMSWIGPRPEALALAEWYERELPLYRYRHVVRPGITGWAQVNQGHVTDLDDVLDKLHYDFYYIKNFSIWLDILIVLRTIKTVITGFGAR